MTRRRRQLLFGTLTGLCGVYFAAVAGSRARHRAEVISADELTTVVQYGIVPWLSLRSRSSPIGAPASLSWELHLSGIAILLIVSALLALFASIACRWLVRHSALVDRCDRCGYMLPNAPAASRCTECGAEGELVASPHAISLRSWWRLLVATSLMGFGFAGLLAHALVPSGSATWLTAIAGARVAALLVGDSTAMIVSLLTFVAGIYAFMIWLYFEPSKHPRPRPSARERRARSAPPAKRHTPP